MTPNQLLIKYALRHPVLIVLTILFGFAGALFNGIGTILIVPLLLAFVGQETSLLKNAPPILQKVISVFDVFPENTRLIAMFAAVFLMIVLKNLTSYVNTLLSSYLFLTLARNIRLDVIDLLFKVDIDYYAKNKIGDIFSRYMSDIVRVVGSIKAYVNLTQNIITIFIFLTALISLSWQLTLISTVLIASLGILNQYYIKKAKKLGLVISRTSKEQTNKFLEILTGIRLIKSVSQEKYELDQMEKMIQEREKAGLDSQMNQAIISPINEIGGIIIVVLIIILGNHFFQNQLETFSAILLTYLLLLFRLMPFVSQLNSQRSQLSNNFSGVEVVTDLLNTKNKPIMLEGNLSFKGLEKGIRFENVSFAYPSYQELVLQKINLWIPKGKMIALVGASGAGKSTIADLLPRFYDPSSGRILFNELDAREYNLKTLRQRMGIVSQDTFLFNNSVRYNIAYGMSRVSDEEIIEAAKRANAYEFITKLPQGLETELGDRGVRLSGGQRQRIAIARALLRNPEILILDEATSALDTVSERLVQQAIDELCKERTTLVIAHRLSTVRKAYQIVVLDKGNIVEVGNHEELLQQGKHYARLYKMQFAEHPNSSEQLNNGKSVSNQPLPSNISYDVRSSLNSLLGSLRLMADGFIDSPEEQQELIEESCSSAMRLLGRLKSFELQQSQSLIETENSLDIQR